MNKDNLTQSTIESERQTLDAAINILLIFIYGLFAFTAGYYIAMSEAEALVKTIAN